MASNSFLSKFNKDTDSVLQRDQEGVDRKQQAQDKILQSMSAGVKQALAEFGLFQNLQDFSAAD